MLKDEEACPGWLYIGTANGDAARRRRPLSDVSDRLSWLSHGAKSVQGREHPCHVMVE
ncbi:hypothetical protein GCM10018784_72720 [Streptomyces hydrogenans]|nr:hypothetical protein GCM10018784_72720 [Streptomyces hydrogenans]